MTDALSPAQMRGARGMLGWSMMDLAKMAQVSISTIKRIEDGSVVTNSDRVIASIRGAFETAGVRFFQDEGGGAGIGLKPQRHTCHVKLCQMSGFLNRTATFVRTPARRCVGTLLAELVL